MNKDFVNEYIALCLKHKKTIETPYEWLNIENFDTRLEVFDDIIRRAACDEWLGTDKEAGVVSLLNEEYQEEYKRLKAIEAKIKEAEAELRNDKMFVENRQMFQDWTDSVTPAPKSLAIEAAVE
jgi:hypothetical protein